MREIIFTLLLMALLCIASFFGAKSAVERQDIPNLIHQGIAEALEDFEVAE